MIDYQVLCHTIAEWKAGQRPASGPHEQAASPEEVEEVASGLVVMDDESAMTYEEMPADEAGYENEGDVTYGDEQAEAEQAAGDEQVEYVDEQVEYTDEQVEVDAEPPGEDGDEDVIVDPDEDDDDEEIPVE